MIFLVVNVLYKILWKLLNPHLGIYNSLLLKIFSYAPKYGSREILIIFGSLSTCDPGIIYKNYIIIISI